MITETDIITGERIQQLADIYLGTTDEFLYNPLIAKDISKHYVIDYIQESFNNPRVVFCYGHCISMLLQKLPFFRNPFVLITHNSDTNMTPTPECMSILNHPLIEKWYAQNAGIDHPKMEVLPIGLANSQWAHGATTFFCRENRDYQNQKIESIYFFFNLHTNFTKRNECYAQLRDSVEFLNSVPVTSYHEILSKYRFCICPEGNGADTHRFWEAVYLKCVPIVLRSSYIEIIVKQFPRLPIVILDSWTDLPTTKLHYDYIKMSSPDYYADISMSYWASRIQGFTL